MFLSKLQSWHHPSKTALNRRLCVCVFISQSLAEILILAVKVSVVLSRFSFFLSFSSSLCLSGINLFSHTSVSRGLMATLVLERVCESLCEIECVCEEHTVLTLSLCVAEHACCTCGMVSRSSSVTVSRAHRMLEFIAHFSKSFHPSLCYSFLKLINN